MSSYASPDSFGLGDAAVEQAIARQLATFMPISVALPCFDDVAPDGWIIFEGQATPGDAPQLLAHYGATLPDLRGRTLVGQGTHADVATVLEGDGLAVAARSPRHNSTVNDPTHGHGVTDPTHGHGVTDPTHGHGVTDPTHVHPAANNPRGWHPGSGSTGSGPYVFNNGTNLDPASPDTPVVTVGAAPTGIGVVAAPTGVGVVAAATGVGVVAEATGITVGPGGARPVDEVPYVVCNWIAPYR